MAIRYLNETEQISITKLCEAIHVARSAYYKWLKRTPSRSQQINEQIVEWIKQHYEETKVIYLSVREISKKWTMPIHDWGLAYAQLSIYFEDRFAA